MSRVQQQLRRAARDFADKIYETLRTDLVRELRRELDPRKVPRAAPAPRAVRQRPAPTTSSAEAFERVLVFVAEHPGTSPKAIIDTTGLRRPVVFRALAEGCAAGAISKAGTWRNVTYSPAAQARSPVVAKTKRSTVGAADIKEDVAAWVRAHPGCTRNDLLAAFAVTHGVMRAALDLAREEGIVHMEGMRRTARYFSVGTSNGAASPETMTTPAS